MKKVEQLEQSGETPLFDRSTTRNTELNKSGGVEHRRDTPSTYLSNI